MINSRWQAPPHCLQLQFYLNVQIDMEDYTRLGPNLFSWRHLNELLILGVFPLDDLKRLLILELALQRRKQVLTKLRSRIKTAESQHIIRLISNALPQAATATGQTVSRPPVSQRDRRDLKPDTHRAKA